MKLGVLGTGNIVTSFFNNIRDKADFEVTAICGRKHSREKIEAFSKDNHIKKIYYNYDEMLMDDEIDTVYVALPNSMHYSESLKALNAGKHVICEKPFTSTLKELQHLIDVSKEKKLFLFEAIIPIHLPNYHEIKKDVEKLGDIKIVNLDFSQYSSRYDAFKKGENPIAFDPQYSGGALMDLNIYNLHFAIGIWDKPVKATYYPNMENGIDTSGIIIMEYPTFKASLIASKDCRITPSAKIMGDKGAIIVESPTSMCKSYILELKENDYKPMSINKDQMPEIMAHEFNDFAHCIDHKDYDTCDQLLLQSMKVMEVCEKIRMEAGIVFPFDVV